MMRSVISVSVASSISSSQSAPELPAGLPRGEIERQFGLQGSTLNSTDSVYFTGFPDSYVQQALREGRDWRDHANVLGPIRNQGSHGTCGTFGRVEVTSSQFNLRSGKAPQSFSEQQLCDCCGAYHDQVPAILGLDSRSRGLEGFEDYPYDPSSSWDDGKFPVPGRACQFDASKVPDGYVSADGRSNGFTKWIHFRIQSEDQTAAFIYRNGPVQGGINSQVFRDYGTKISHGLDFITKDMCANYNTQDIDHSINIVGFGTDPSKGPYWVVKNSWSDTWANHGYIKVYRGIGCVGINAIIDGVPAYGDWNDYFSTGQSGVTTVVA